MYLAIPRNTQNYPGLPVLASFGGSGLRSPHREQRVHEYLNFKERRVWRARQDGFIAISTILNKINSYLFHREVQIPQKWSYHAKSIVSGVATGIWRRGAFAVKVTFSSIAASSLSKEGWWSFDASDFQALRSRNIRVVSAFATLNAHNTLTLQIRGGDAATSYRARLTFKGADTNH